MNLKIIMNHNQVEAYLNEDLVGFIKINQIKEEGFFIEHSLIISESNKGLGIGKKMYLFLLSYAKDNQIKLFKMKNSSLESQFIWNSLIKNNGIRFIERKDLMSTSHELEIDISHFKV